MCTQCIQAMLNVLVTSVYLFDIADEAGAIGTHGGNQQGDTGTDIRARHPATTQLALEVVAKDTGTVWVAEGNLSTHITQANEEDQQTLKHLLKE